MNNLKLEIKYRGQENTVKIDTNTFSFQFDFCGKLFMIEATNGKLVDDPDYIQSVNLKSVVFDDCNISRIIDTNGESVNYFFGIRDNVYDFISVNINSLDFKPIKYV